MQQSRVWYAGYSWEALEPCWRWLAPCVEVVREAGSVCVVRNGDGEFMQRSGGLDLICPDVNLDESHRIQSHNVTLDMFVSIKCSLSSTFYRLSEATESCPLS